MVKEAIGAYKDNKVGADVVQGQRQTDQPFIAIVEPKSSQK